MDDIVLVKAKNNKLAWMITCPGIDGIQFHFLFTDNPCFIKYLQTQMGS